MATPLDIKCLIIGDSGSGKTYAASKYLTGRTRTEYAPTILENLYKETDELLLGLCDTSGEDRYAEVRSRGYANSDVILGVVDLTNAKSLENLKQKWVPEARRYLPEVPILIVGTKLDIWMPDKD